MRTRAPPTRCPAPRAASSRVAHQFTFRNHDPSAARGTRRRGGHWEQRLTPCRKSSNMSSDLKKDATGNRPNLALDRRTFLQALGTAFSVAALPEVLASCTTQSESISVNEEELVVDGGQYSVV